MEIKVHLLAFGRPNEVRMVQLPPGCLQVGDVQEMLDLVFHYGQNDFQPQNHLSVSAGDVIELPMGLGYYFIAPMGFKEITLEDFVKYRMTEQRDRFFSTLRD